jgi:hypothetical protein
MLSKTRFGSLPLGWKVAALVAVALMGVLAAVVTDAYILQGEIEVRVSAMRRADGDVVFALQQRQPDGDWGQRQQPRRNRLQGMYTGRWANSTPVSVTWEVELGRRGKVVAIVPQAEIIEGVEVEVDRVVEVTTVSVAPPASTVKDHGMLSDDGGLGRYTAFCSNSKRHSPLHRYENGKALSSALWASRNREITAAEWADLIEMELQVWTAITPPASFDLFHRAMVTGLQSVLRAARARDPALVVMNMGPQPTVFLTGERRLAWVSDLPNDVIRLLKFWNCVHVAETEDGLMGG